MKIIAVAAAVILNDQQQIFIAKRKKEAHQGGLWEFPGGKIEPGESAEQALIRELDEEIGIQVQSVAPFISISFAYPDKSVLLDVFLVRDFFGKAYGREGQETAWVSIDQLSSRSFPEANITIIEKLMSQQASLLRPV